ncbi:MAG: PEP-CTERM sorting domain-containing protein [Planctomycetota bacterium]|nr:PEP-CTERM sorting domain-containing protein [Planctomycetota bacterium]
MVRATLVLAVLAMITSVAAGALPHSFTGLGELSPGSGFTSEARACSADGTVVVGTGTTPSGARAFMWTRPLGQTGPGTMTVLAQPTGQLQSWGNDVSADGRYVVGWTGSNFGSNVGWEGVRWGPGGSLDRISVAGNGVWAKSISGDGSIVAGGLISQAFTWTPADGVVPLSGAPGSGYNSNAEAISANGLVVVGDYVDPTNGATRDAYRWTQAAGMVGMGGGFTAVGTSDDGSVVVGMLMNGDAYRWTAATGPVSMGTYEPGARTYARGVSRDGSRVVGNIEFSDDTMKAFIWDQTNGIRILQDVLEQDCGLDLTGWTLTRAWDVSMDGPTIVGRGYHNGVEEAWVATLPEPATLALLAMGGLALLRRRR